MNPDFSWLTARPIAHRGYHDLNRTRWENTLSAFEAACARNYAIECDVHLSADSVPVVFHDPELKRLTGLEGLVHDKTVAELAEVKIGGADDHVPTLAEMLALVAGRVPIIVEMKTFEDRNDGIVAKVGAILQNYSGHVAIMSFDHEFVRQFARDAPDIPGGLTAAGRANRELEEHFSMLAHQIEFVSFAVKDLPNRFVSMVRDKLDMPVITWTVRDDKMVKKTFEYADQMTFEGFEPDV